MVLYLVWKLQWNSRAVSYTGNLIINPVVDYLSFTFPAVHCTAVFFNLFSEVEPLQQFRLLTEPMSLFDS